MRERDLGSTDRRQNHHTLLVSVLCTTTHCSITRNNTRANAYMSQKRTKTNHRIKNKTAIPMAVAGYNTDGVNAAAPSPTSKRMYFQHGVLQKTNNKCCHGTVRDNSNVIGRDRSCRRQPMRKRPRPTATTIESLNVTFRKPLLRAST